MIKGLKNQIQIFLNRLSLKKISSTPKLLIFACKNCGNELRVPRNYGEINSPCNCGKIYSIQTGKNLHPRKKEKAIFEELEIRELNFNLNGNRYEFSGRAINTCNQYITESVACFKVANCDREFLFFPGMNYKSNEQVDIAPFESFYFSNLLPENETDILKNHDLSTRKLSFLQYDKVHQIKPNKPINRTENTSALY